MFLSRAQWTSLPPLNSWSWSWWRPDSIPALRLIHCTFCVSESGPTSLWLHPCTSRSSLTASNSDFSRVIVLLRFSWTISIRFYWYSKCGNSITNLIRWAVTFVSLYKACLESMTRIMFVCNYFIFESRPVKITVWRTGKNWYCIKVLFNELMFHFCFFKC